MKYTVNGILPSSCLNDQYPTGSPGVHDSGNGGEKTCNAMNEQLESNKIASEYRYRETYVDGLANGPDGYINKCYFTIQMHNK